MTYCIDFFRKFKKDGNFCGLDKSQVSRLTAYLEIVELLMKQKIPEEQVYENFSVNAARPLLAAKDTARTEGLNFVTSQLKEGKKVTNGEVQKKLESWSTPTTPADHRPAKSCSTPTSAPEQKPDPVQETVPPVTDADRERKARLNPPDACHDGESKPLTEPVKASFGALAKEPLVPGPGVPVAPQKAPCVDAKTFKLCPDGECHVKTEANTRGRVCVLWNAQCSQLPGDACYIEYRNAHRNDKKSGNGFVPASQLAAANKDPGIREGKPAIPDRTLTITFSPDQWTILEKLQKAGVADGYAGAVMFCVDEIGNRSA